VQGWHPRDYVRCIALYADAGVDLAVLPLVGVGSVCRRQNTAEGEEVLRICASAGLNVHGFGVKEEGVLRAVDVLACADSMAWSKAARNQRITLPGCAHNCNSCPRWALLWYAKMLRTIEGTGAANELMARAQRNMFA